MHDRARSGGVELRVGFSDQESGTQADVVLAALADKDLSPLLGIGAWVDRNEAWAIDAGKDLGSDDWVVHAHGLGDDVA